MIASQVVLPYSLMDAAYEALAEIATDEDGRLCISHYTMAGFFKPSLERIAARAKQMLGRAGSTDYIVLVGGFSGSEHAVRYLTKELQLPCRSVIAPTYRQSAVLEGGVWHARYPSSIAARCSSMSYGVRAATSWKPGAPSKVWLKHKQGYRCLEGFHRYVARDELVKSGSTISKGFVPLYPNQTAVAFDIYGSLQRDAQYTTEDSMMKVASVHIDIPPGSCPDPDDYSLTCHFSFGEVQISVRCVDEQTGEERRARLKFDSTETLKDQLSMVALY